MCTYLHGPRDGGMYYFRRGIPARLRPIIGAREFFFSLGVKDRETAKRLIPQHTADSQRKLDAAQASFDGASRPASAKAPTAVERSTSLTCPISREEFEWEQEGMAYAFRISADEDYETEEAEALKKALAHAPERLSHEQRLFSRVLNEEREKTENYRARYRRRKMSDAQREAAQAALATVAVATAPIAPFAAVSLIKTFEAYATQPGIALRQATIGQWRSIIEHLVKFLGHDDAVAVIDRDLIRWRNHLVIEETKNGKPRSAKTINGSYIAAANVVFSYAKDAGIIESNPARDLVKVRAARIVKLREKDFTLVERKTVLAAALIPVGGKTSSERIAARRWVPWLCAYTGARVNEMTQLRAEDVRQHDGVWAIHITPDAGDVKTDAARWVPLHEHLIEQGFLDFVKCKAGPLFYVPGDMKRGTNKRVGMWLAEWVRKIGVMDQAIKPNHAWRHTFKTICTEVGIEERAADYMQGHVSKGVGRSYGSNTLVALSVQMAKFPRYEVFVHCPT